MRLSAARLVFCLCFVIVGAASAPAESAAATPEPLQEYSRALVNEARTRYGLPPLAAARLLQQAAQRHANDMLARGYFSHASPEGRNVMDRYRAVGGSPNRLVGENIAHCENCSPQAGRAEVESLHEGWMNSPRHRAAILGEGFSEFGFAIAEDGQGRRYAVQTFGGPGTADSSAAMGATTPIDGAALNRLMVERLNELRQHTGAPPLTVDSALVSTAADLLPADNLLQISVKSEKLLARLPEHSRWRRFQLVSASCGGCGREPNSADVGRFVQLWRENSAYASILLDPDLRAIGVAMVADGRGGKAAVAILAGP